MTTQLTRLARPFAPELVEHLPGGAKRPPIDYVGHATISQALLVIVGPYDWNVQPVRDAGGTIVGALGTLRCTIDGRDTTVTEVGVDEDEKHDGDGERLKNASSDALKRCAMRLGLGLHLWAKGPYFLHDVLSRREQPTEGEA